MKKGKKKWRQNFGEKYQISKLAHIGRLPENTTVIFSVPVFHGEQAKLASLTQIGNSVELPS